MKIMYIIAHLNIQYFSNCIKLKTLILIMLFILSLPLVNAGNVVSTDIENKFKINAWIVKKRINVGEILNNDLVEVKQVDVSNGFLHDIKNILLTKNIQLKNFETTQTLIEGQYLTHLNIREIPDLHRGDSVRVKLISGAVILQATGISQELGYINKKLKVKIVQSKREVIGVLQSNGVVEVIL